MNGRIKTLRETFGFIYAEGAGDHFFHRGDVSEASAYDFDQLEEGDTVSFVPVEPRPEKGPRAQQVAWQEAEQ